MQQLIKLHSTGAMIILAILNYLIGMLSHGTDFFNHDFEVYIFILYVYIYIYI